MGKGRANQSVVGKKQKKKVAEEESELEWQFVVFFVRSAASDLKITFILSVFIPGMLIIPDTSPSLFITAMQSFLSYYPFRSVMRKKKGWQKCSLQEYFDEASA